MKFWLGIALTCGMAAAEEPIDAAVKRAVVTEIAAKLNEHYVFPDKARLMSERLKRRLKDGAYDRLDDPTAFANKLTEDLQAVHADLHLSVVHTDQPLSADGAPDMVARYESLRRVNFNFRKLEWLPGNIGYLRMDGFMSAAMAGRTAEAALAFLAHTDALIIDLRNNSGGSPTMIALMYSYFFKDSTHFNDFYIRKGEETQQFWTTEYVSGQKMIDVPIFVLTSSRTFSAAEGFSYHLKHLKRATIVGEATGGGAHPTQRFPLEDPRFFVSIPFGRAVNPITGDNWEGGGVQPDVAVPAAQALDKAQLLALQVLAEKDKDPIRQKELAWRVDVLNARLDPLKIDNAMLPTFAGQYGPRKIVFEEGQLIYSRGKGPKMVMIPMGPDLFRFEEYDPFRLKFERTPDGAIKGLMGLYADGTKDYFDKN